VLTTWSKTESRARIVTAAAAVARFEAETAPRIAAEPPQASLEDLRLQMPVLRPLGCWCMECAPALAAHAA